MGLLRRLLPRLALAAGSLLAVLLLAEGAARLDVEIDHRRAQREVPARPLTRYHAQLGWEKNPLAAQRVRRHEFDVLLSVNSRGLRGPERDYAVPPGTERVLLLGDSFAAGYYVEEHETVRAVLEASLGACGPHEVINGGTVAYSTDQELLFYRLEGRRYGARTVVLLFYPNDLFFNASPQGPSAEPKPYFELDGEQLVLRNSPVPALAQGDFNRPGAPPRPRPWRGSYALRWLTRRTVDSSPRLHAALARLGLVEPASTVLPREYWPYGPGQRGEVDWMWRVTTALLRALRDEAGASGARLVVLYVPVRFEVNDGVWELTRRRYTLGRRWDREAVLKRLREACAGLGIPLVDPSDGLRAAESAGPPAYYTRDVHWTATGNEVAGRVLASFLTAGDGCPPGR